MAGRAWCMGQDTATDLQRSMGNSTSIEFFNVIVQAPSFINVITSISTKRQAFEQAEKMVRASFDTLEATKQEELYDSFPRTSGDFSRVLAGAIWLMSAVNQEKSVNSENINQRNRCTLKL
jgi:hypothetical protein